MIFKGNGCPFSWSCRYFYSERESLRSTEHGSLQILTVLEKPPCITVTNFGGKVSVFCNWVWVHYQILLYLDTNDMDAIAINKLCKLNFRYSTMYLAISQQQGYQGLL